MKIHLLDSVVQKLFFKIFGFISAVLTILLIFIDVSIIFEYLKISSSQNLTMRFFLLVIFVVFLFIIYLIAWLVCNFNSKITLHITKSTIEIKYGDIFKEDQGFIVIGCNEYFDTIVDNKIISDKSLHGIFINQNYKNEVELKGLDLQIDTAITSFENNDNIKMEINQERQEGKTKRVPLGKIIQINNFLLLSLTHFDKYNKAYLGINDYINCLLEFWKEIDRIYNGQEIAIPLLGSKFTRIEGHQSISNQELLELMLLTFKWSKININSKIKIILYKDKGKTDKENTMNLLKLKEIK